jgi:hypothetical protein
MGVGGSREGLLLEQSDSVAKTSAIEDPYPYLSPFISRLINVVKLKIVSQVT